MSICSISYSQYLTLRGDISQRIAPLPRTVLSLYRENSPTYLSTRIPYLDDHLLGGLLPGTVTEICGPPGSGKTQFCLTMSVYCSAPNKYNGRGLKVVYIDTEGTFSAQRLLEIAKHNYPLEVVEEIAKRVTVCTELTCNELDKVISSLEDDISETGLICVDSIASLLRKEFSTQTIKALTDRNSFLYNCITRLKLLAQKYKIVVIVTNQIVVKIPNADPAESDVFSSEGVVCASLGNTWYHSVNARLMLEIRDVSMGTRTLSVIKSPVSPVVSMTIKIDSKGFVKDNINN